ncbi:MAG: MgtC/SapB transporter [Acidobacteriaceae bacterium]|nr:MgtC/SapB transporter [Acidobacteriaceae bacterium]
MKQIWDALSPHMDLATFVSDTVLKLVIAAILGGVIGLERELKRKPAGLRTNMFICFGSAMYTLLSSRFSHGSFGSFDPNRIAAQIIPGIGFIGAGAILHSGGSVSGITTAATMFVVASIGMAVGGGEYLSATFATVVILLALNVLGWVEGRFNFKSVLMSYEVASKDPERVLTEVNRILEEQRLLMQTVKMGMGNNGHRIQFTVEAKHRDHVKLTEKLRQCTEVERVDMLRDTENE